MSPAISHYFYFFSLVTKTGMTKLNKTNDNINHVIEIGKDTLADTNEHPQFPVSILINKLNDELPPLSPNCCIYRVPPKVRNLNEKVYAPQVVAIGPFHHGEQKLQPMEEHKLRYLQAFLLRIRHNLSLEDCENVITKWEKRIRNSYAENFDLTSDQFVKIVLVDSCFVIEAILSYSSSIYKRTIYLPKSNFLYETDMMLLENQLPFFVLDGLYHLAFPHEPKTKFLELCIRYFFYRMLIQVDVDRLITKVKDYLAASSHKIQHFVDLLRVCHLPSALRLRSDERFDLVTIPKVTEAHEAGIELKKASSIFPLDIQYTPAVLEIPQVVVDEASEYLLSNILVLEMCHYKHNSYVRDYVFFMDMLIDTPKDVDLLIQNGIIVSWTRDSSAVANLFNNAGYNFPIISAKYYFYNVSRDLKAYCSVPRHRWKAAFKRDYCSTPWIIASTTAAVILLLLTFIQTISSIRSF